jgi:hypothetical protein
MAEFETLSFTNPTKDDFVWRYNGEPYAVGAGQTVQYSKNVAYHLARHLSTKMIVDKLKKTMTKKQIENRNDPIHRQVAQLNNYDTHQRRIVLYDIFGKKEMVQETIERFPFKGFVGDMNEYDSYVAKKENIVKESEIEGEEKEVKKPKSKS